MSDDTQLPDDAEQKINELLSALHESETEMVGDSEAEEAGLADEMEAVAAEETIPDEEGDYVDLDAELLDNSADMLQLDEQDSLEAQLQVELAAAEPPLTKRPMDNLSSQDLLAAARQKELEQEMLREKVAPLHVPTPVRARENPFSRITPLFAVLAMVLSAAALWFALNVSPAPATMVAPVDGGERAALAGLKGELAALHERLSAVEKQADDGKEAVVMLERMQGILARMEQKILTRNLEGEFEAPAEVTVSASSVVGKSAAQNVVSPKSGAVVESEQAQPIAVTRKASRATETGGDSSSDASKVFIKGWAVNLRSYYHKLDAERLQQRYQDDGIDAEIREIPKGSATWYRVRVMGFASKKKAEAFIEGLTIEQGRDMAWPSYYEGYVEG